MGGEGTGVQSASPIFQQPRRSGTRVPVQQIPYIIKLFNIVWQMFWIIKTIITMDGVIGTGHEERFLQRIVLQAPLDVDGG